MQYLAAYVPKKTPAKTARAPTSESLPAGREAEREISVNCRSDRLVDHAGRYPSRLPVAETVAGSAGNWRRMSLPRHTGKLGGPVSASTESPQWQSGTEVGWRGILGRFS